MSQVLPWTKFTPFEGPLGHVLYSEQAIILKHRAARGGARGYFLTESTILT